MKKTFLSLLLVLALLLCSCAPAVSDEATTEPVAPSQSTAPTTLSTEPPTTEPPTSEPSAPPTDPNDPETADIHLLVNTYFSERASFLMGIASDIPSAITPIVNDEQKHLDALTSHHAMLLTSSYAIHSIAKWDKAAEVSVTETVTYRIDNTEAQHIIPHEIIIDYTRNDGIIISSDAYYDEAADFYSCSYIRLPDGYSGDGA